MEARAMRIEAGLPTCLWNEIIRTAGYIMDRTPMQKHDWKTPFEQAVGTLPNLHHLRIIGCKAYALDGHIPRKEKLHSAKYSLGTMRRLLLLSIFSTATIKSMKMKLLSRYAEQHT